MLVGSITYSPYTSMAKMEANVDLVVTEPLDNRPVDAAYAGDTVATFACLLYRILLDLMTSNIESKTSPDL